MPIPQGFQKAKLEIDGQEPIECGFNPQEYTIIKTNVWTFKPRTGVDLPDGEFGGGNPRMIRLALLLDVSLLGENESIRSVTDRLFKMMETGGGGGGGTHTLRLGIVSGVPRLSAIGLSMLFASAIRRQRVGSP